LLIDILSEVKDNEFLAADGDGELLAEDNKLVSLTRRVIYAKVLI